MNCLFTVQGEGRGHMTQALALSSILRKAGHRVSSVLVGRSSARPLPAFFLDKIGAPVCPFASPNFVYARNRSIRVGPTLFEAVRSIPTYRRSLQTIADEVEQSRPDLIVNFFEPLAGIHQALYRPLAPMVSIGHQYLAHHPDFHFPPGRQGIDRVTLQWFTDLTALGAVKRLALGFTRMGDGPERRITVVPPLLRTEVFELTVHTTEPFLLVYLLNSGYGQEVVRWHERHPEVVLHCFWDNITVPPEYSPRPNLTFHFLDDRKFLSLMSRCTGLACTGGFESVCEAMYLGKPVMMVPVEGHYEQHCNALDASRNGAGITSRTFDFDRFLAYLPYHTTSSESFRHWVSAAPQLFLSQLEQAAEGFPLPIHGLVPAGAAA